MTSAYDSISRSLSLSLGRVNREENTSYLPEDEPETPSIIRHVTVERKNVLQRVTYGELVDEIKSHVQRIHEFCDARRRLPTDTDLDIDGAPTEDDVNSAVFEVGRISCLRLLLPEKVGDVNEFSPSALLGRLGAVSALVDLLTLVSNPSTSRQPLSALHTFLQYALDSLWNLAAFSENKELLVRNDVIPALVAFSSRFELQKTDLFDPDNRKRRRAVATILHNVSEFRFRNGEQNQVQRRILEEGGADLAVVLLKASLACREDETSIITALTISHLIINPGAMTDFPILNEGLELCIESIIKKGLHLDSKDVFQGWLSLIPFVALLENSESNDNLLYIRLFALEILSVFFKNDPERSARKLIRDLAMMSGISTLRRIAANAPHDILNTTIESDADNKQVTSIIYKCSRLARSIIDDLKAAPLTTTIPIDPDTLRSDISKLFLSSDYVTSPSTISESEEAAALSTPSVSLKRPLHSDATLQCIDNGIIIASFPIHRAIIAARLPSLAPLLSTSNEWAAASSLSSTVDIHSSSPKGIEALLQWCYSSKPRLTSENALEALEVADFYCCNGLKNQCELFLCQAVNQTTADNLLDIALRFNAPQLATFAKGHLNRRSINEKRELEQGLEQEQGEKKTHR